MNKNLKALAFSGLLAAVYAVLTIALGFIGYGPIQFRVAEALTIIPYFTPFGIYGLTIGCFIANVFSPYGILDWIAGTAATLLGALLTNLCAKKNLWYLAPLPPVLTNMLIIGWLIAFESGVFTFGTFISAATTVGLGQFVVCYGLGLPFLLLLNKHKNKIKL
jgi:uncharacterized membrane protein